MRRVVGILRDAGDASSAPPMPATTDTTTPASPEGLDELVERFRQQGLPVQLRQSVDATDWPPEVTSTVYRIVREALTNVAPHAPEAAAVTVTTRPVPPGITVEVVNAASPAPVRRSHHPGYGLVGMRERVTALGGTLHAGPRADGGWSVVATLPTSSAPPMTIRVLIADDQAMIRSGLRLVLEDQPDISVIAEASDGVDAIVEAVRAAHNGDALVSPSVTVRLLRHLATAGPPRAMATTSLSERELEVVRAIARGRTNQEIGAELFISLSTVKSHVSTIQTTLGLRNRVEIAAWAFENRVIEST